MSEAEDFGYVDPADGERKAVPYLQPHGPHAHLYFEYHKKYGRNSVCATHELEKLSIPSNPLGRAIQLMKDRVGQLGIKKGKKGK